MPICVINRPWQNKFDIKWCFKEVYITMKTSSGFSIWIYLLCINLNGCTHWIPKGKQFSFKDQIFNRCPSNPWYSSLHYLGSQRQTGICGVDKHVLNVSISTPSCGTKVHLKYISGSLRLRWRLPQANAAILQSHLH